MFPLVVRAIWGCPRVRQLSCTACSLIDGAVWSIALMSGILCTRLARVPGVRRVVAGNARGEGCVEFAGCGSHEDAGAEELGERCGDAGSGGQDQGGAPDH